MFRDCFTDGDSRWQWQALLCIAALNACYEPSYVQLEASIQKASEKQSELQAQLVSGAADMARIQVSMFDGNSRVTTHIVAHVQHLRLDYVHMEHHYTEYFCFSAG